MGNGFRFERKSCKPKTHGAQYKVISLTLIHLIRYRKSTAYHTSTISVINMVAISSLTILRVTSAVNHTNSLSSFCFELDHK